MADAVTLPGDVKTTKIKRSTIGRFGPIVCKSRFAEGVKNSEGHRRVFRVEI
jgi:hypothetical protein